MVNFNELDFDGVVSTLKYEINFCNQQIGLVKTSNARTFFVERALMLADIVHNIRKMSILGDDLDEVAEVVEVAEMSLDEIWEVIEKEGGFQTHSEDKVAEVVVAGCRNCEGTGEIYNGDYYMVCSCKKNKIEEGGV
jgi:hypothetical protein